MKRYGCKFGQPHDLMQVRDTPRYKHEVCRRCNKKFRWNKGKRGRIQNAAYLKAHVRNFAQPGGATKREFMKLYRQEQCIIKL